MRTALANLEVDGTKLEDLALDFTLPGYDIELRVRIALFRALIHSDKHRS